MKFILSFRLHATKRRKMKWYFSVCLASTIFLHAFSTITPKDVEPGWLTLSTGASNTAQPSTTNHEKQPIDQTNDVTSSIVSQQQNEEEIANNPAQEVVKKGRGQYFRGPATLEKQKAYWTKERREAQSKRFRGIRFYSPHTSDTKSKLSIALKGRKLSEETKEKMRKSHLGLKHSEETKDKLKKLKSRLKEQKQSENYGKSDQ